ncbi:hypothetical protein, partial [Leptospira licerasiae]|uniref:hypothetical protein n=2 Tax=Leptospira TaxID=171 RepID=UPI003018C72E
MPQTLLKPEFYLENEDSNGIYRKSETWSELGISLRLNPNKPAKYLTLVTEESRVEGKKNTER